MVTAGTGAEALALASSSHPDLVVLDLGLPDLDGVEIVGRLRSWSSVTIGTHVVDLVAHTVTPRCT